MSLLYIRPGDSGFRNLRPGWRFAIYLLLMLLAIVVFSTVEGLVLFALRHGARGSLGMTAWFTGISEGVDVGAVFLATWILARWEGCHLGDYGVPGKLAFGRSFWQGVVWGGLSLTLLLVLIWLSGAYSFGNVANHGAVLAEDAVEWALAFLAVGFFEEMSFRGYPLTTMTASMGFWPAAILTSVIFGGLHLGNLGESWVGALSAGLIGLFFAFTWWRTGTLWFAIGMHAAWDYCESFVFGVPDSGTISQGRLLAPAFHGSRWVTGGSVGPEGSLWVFVVIGLLFLTFAWLYPARAIATSPNERSSASSTV